MKISVDENITLETVELSNAEEIFSVVECSRQTLRKWLPWVDGTKTVEDVKVYLQNCLEQTEAKSDLVFSINENHAVVGLIGIHRINHVHKSTVIGYWLGVGSHGKGIITKAVNALCTYCFDELDMNRIEIACATENIKSQNIAIRNGFKLEGVLRQREVVNGVFFDHQIYSLLKSEKDGNKL